MESIEVDMNIIELCCSLAMEAHASPEPFIVSTANCVAGFACTIFAFPGSWSASDWIDTDCGGGIPPFGTVEVDTGLFPSMRRIGEDVKATANASFLKCFKRLLADSTFKAQVIKAVAGKQQIHFTGHSLGGAIAILSTIWCLEHLNLGSNSQVSPFCVTFGSPLVGDAVFCVSLDRENWSRYFLNFVTKTDIVPSILLTPLSYFKEELQSVLYFLCPKSLYFSLETIGKSQVVFFYSIVSRNALQVSNYISCFLMGCANSFFGSLTAFVKLSPYKPFGTYIFCTREGHLISVKNSIAALQVLVHYLKWESEQDQSEIAYRGLNEHLQYMPMIENYSKLQNECVLPKYSINEFGDEQPAGAVSKYFQLSREVRLCLHALGQWEKQRLNNQARVGSSCKKIQEALQFLYDYRMTCELRGLNYYDSFKLQKNTEDFDANVKRLELAGIWDEIVEMLRRCELPSSFEAQMDWVNLGTSYRNLVEPLDIANYYRHTKNEDTGSYMVKGRPKRYQYTERWYKHTQKIAAGSSSESCFWAVVEELSTDTCSKPFGDVRQKIVEFEAEVLGWFTSGKLGSDVLVGDSTFVAWWRTLPEEHKLESCIHGFVTDAKAN